MDHAEPVEGLTTAAGIRMTSAIGMAAGVGMEAMAIATALIALAVVGAIPRIMRSRDDSSAGRSSLRSQD